MRAGDGGLETGVNCGFRMWLVFACGVSEGYMMQIDSWDGWGRWLRGD